MSLYHSRQCAASYLNYAQIAHRLLRCLLYDAQLHRKVKKTLAVRADCDLSSVGVRTNGHQGVFFAGVLPNEVHIISEIELNYVEMS